MQDFLSGTDISVVVPLLRDDIPIIPTVGTTVYTVFNHDGLAISGLVLVPVTTTTTTFALSITLPAAATVITTPKLFERRTILVNFTSNGKVYNFEFPLRLIPFLNHGLTPQDVREFIGVGKNELSDNGIDLTAAYFYVKDDFTTASLPSLLSSGTLTEMAARECIRMQAVINIIPSLRQRMAQMESDGIHQFRRANIDKFDTMEKQAWDRYVTSRSVATGVALNTRTLVVTTLDADVITGA